VYLAFENFNLWEDLRRLFDRGIARLGREKTLQPAGH
jgi:hypothetical protein